MLSRAFCLGVGLACIAGCSTTAGNQFSVDAARQIKPGVTDKHQVIQYLGTPLSRVSINGSETWTYTSARSSVDLGAQNFIPIVGPFLPGAQGGSYDMTSVKIDFHGDVVAKCTLTTLSTSAQSQGGMNGAIISTLTPNQNITVSDCS